MKYAVLLHEERHLARNYHSEGLELLRAHGDVDLITMKSGEEAAALEPFAGLMEKADAAVIGAWMRPALRPEHWQASKNLKVFSGTFDNRFEGWVDIDYLDSRKIPLIDTSRGMTPSVAEFAFALTLNLIRDIPNSLYLVREGGWIAHVPMNWERPGFVYGDLTGRRVGLAGLGSINQRYAELLAPWHCEVSVYDPYVSDETIVHYGGKRVSSLVELAKNSEVFNVGIPPMADTMQIINRDVIYALPKGALFVITTRMQVVEQEPLWERIKNNEISAGIDVFLPEPPPADAWFRKHPNVIATPHVAGGTDFCHRRCFTDACKEAIAVLEGREPRFRTVKRDYLIYEGKMKN